MTPDIATPTPAQAAPASGWAPRILQWILLVVVTVILLFTVLWWLAGTRTARGWFIDYIGDRTGAEWQVGRMRVQWPCDIVCEDVAMRGVQGGRKGAITIKALRMGWRNGQLRRVTVELPEITLVEDGVVWQPSFLHGVGKLRDIWEVAGLIEELAPGIELEISGGVLRFTDKTGATLSEMAGVDFVSGPVNIPDRAMRYYRLDARMVLRPGGGRGQNVHREWISTPLSGYVELEYRGQWQGDENRRDVWSRPDQRQRPGK